MVYLLLFRLLIVLGYWNVSKMLSVAHKSVSLNRGDRYTNMLLYNFYFVIVHKQECNGARGNIDID